MIKKSIFLTVFILLSAAVIYFVIQNSTEVDVIFFKSFSGETSYEVANVNLGAVIFASLGIGFVIAWIFAAFLVFKGLIVRKKVEHDVKRKEKFINTILTAREAFAAKNYEGSKATWKALKKQDPSKVLANVEISKVLESEGKINEALKLVDQARAAAPKNLEVLFRAVDLNVILGNPTAALDNLALILSHHPNQKAALMARDLSEKAHKFADALEYNEKALELGNVPDYKQARSRLELSKLLETADVSSQDGRLLFKKDLKKFIKKNKTSTEAQQQLAELESQDGNPEAAAELLYNASSINNDVRLWHTAVKLWIDNNSPDRALATAKIAVKQTSGLGRIKSELDLIKVNLLVNKFDQAHELIKTFPELVADQDIDLPEELEKDFIFLKGYCLNKLGQTKEAAVLWAKLCKLDFDPEMSHKKPARKQPGHELSTP